MTSWTSDPGRLNSDTELQRLLNLVWGVPDEVWPTLSAAGLWDCLPVGRILSAGSATWQRAQVLVLRLVPGRPLERCPLALATVKHGESSLIADHREALLPSYLYERLYLDSSAVCDHVRARPDAEWELLAQTWGCQPERAQRIRASLDDADVRAALAAQDGHEARTEHISALRAWCAGLPREALVRFIEVASLDLPWAPPDLDAAGAWREPLSLFNAEAVGEHYTESEQQGALLEALRVPMSHEANYQTADLYTGACTGTAWIDYSLHADIAAEMKVRVDSGAFADALETPQGALIRAACAFAAAGPGAYDGQAHVDAASTLAEAGDMAGSLCALLTAISWQRARLGAPLKSSLHAWIQGTAEAGPAYALHHELARQHLDIVETAERAAGRSLLR